MVLPIPVDKKHVFEYWYYLMSKYSNVSLDLVGIMIRYAMDHRDEYTTCCSLIESLSVKCNSILMSVCYKGWRSGVYSFVLRYMDELFVHLQGNRLFYYILSKVHRIQIGTRPKDSSSWSIRGIQNDADDAVCSYELTLFVYPVQVDSALLYLEQLEASLQVYLTVNDELCKMQSRCRRQEEQLADVFNCCDLKSQILVQLEHIQTVLPSSTVYGTKDVCLSNMQLQIIPYQVHKTYSSWLKNKRRILDEIQHLPGPLKCVTLTCCTSMSELFQFDGRDVLRISSTATAKQVVDFIKGNGGNIYNANKNVREWIRHILPSGSLYQDVLHSTGCPIHTLQPKTCSTKTLTLLIAIYKDMIRLFADTEFKKVLQQLHMPGDLNWFVCPKRTKYSYHRRTGRPTLYIPHVSFDPVQFTLFLRKTFS